MKLQLEINDELWKRVELGASLLDSTPEAYVIRLLESRAQRVPDPEGAERRIAAIRASAGPEDDYDIDEFLRALEFNRGRRTSPAATESNGVPR